MNELPTLYLSPSDAANEPVIHFLDNNGIGYREAATAPDEGGGDRQKPSAAKEDNRLPILLWTDGQRVENCDVPKLTAFLRDRGVEFEDS